MKVLWMMMVAASAGGGSSMTVSMEGADDLPSELKPIVAGGSWFDDMAIKRLKEKHKELKELGRLHSHEHEEDPEEVFIMAHLKKETDTSDEDSDPIKSPPKAQNNREALRTFLRHHTRHGQEEGKAKARVTTSTEFMEMYEKELQKFFKNFMSAMLQAEIGGVSIENHSDEDEEVFPISPSGDRSNVVVTP